MAILSQFGQYKPFDFYVASASADVDAFGDIVITVPEALELVLQGAAVSIYTNLTGRLIVPSAVSTNTITCRVYRQSTGGAGGVSGLSPIVSGTDLGNISGRVWGM